jgi:hypothetical protein
MSSNRHVEIEQILCMFRLSDNKEVRGQADWVDAFQPSCQNDFDTWGTSAHSICGPMNYGGFHQPEPEWNYLIQDEISCWSGDL